MMIRKRLFFIAILTFSIFVENSLGAARCKKTARLTTYVKSTTHDGFHYDRTFVNKSVPVNVTYLFENIKEVNSISWRRNGKDIKIGDSERSDFYYQQTSTVEGLEISLIFPVPTAISSGVYDITAEVDGDDEILTLKAQCTVESSPVLKTRHSAVRTDVGYNATVDCTVETRPLPSQVSWKRVIQDDQGGYKESNVEKAVFRDKDGMIRGTMILPNTDSEQTGFYMCTVSDGQGNNDRVIFQIRIKDLFTYLYPVIGIVIEIIVLTMIIIVYEWNQSKRHKLIAQREQLKSNPNLQ